MKHEEEIEEFLRGLVYNETMSEDEYNQIVEETLKVMDITKQTLSDHLETGVVNGHSIEAFYTHSESANKNIKANNSRWKRKYILT